MRSDKVPSQVKSDWLVKVAKMLNEEFFLGRVDYTRRTETITDDGKEYRREVHEKVPVAVRIKVDSILLHDYDSFKAMVNCHPASEPRYSTCHHYQVCWSKLHEDEQSAINDASHEIQEFAQNMKVLKGDDTSAHNE